MNTALINRVKSFIWRLSMMVGVALLNYVSVNYTGFGLSPELTIVVGLVVGEISKFLNTEMEGKEVVTFVKTIKPKKTVKK